MQLNRFAHRQFRDIRDFAELPVHHAHALDQAVTRTIADLHQYREQVVDLRRGVIDPYDAAIHLSAEDDFDDTEVQISLEALTTVYADLFPHQPLKISFNADYVAYLIEAPDMTMNKLFDTVDAMVLSVLEKLLNLRRKLMLGRRVRDQLHLSAHGIDPDQLYSAMLAAGISGDSVFDLLREVG